MLKALLCIAALIVSIAGDGRAQTAPLRPPGIDACVSDDRSGDTDCLQDLPLEVHPAARRSDTLVILMSGDGGWQEVEQQVTRQFNDSGVSVVGLNSLKYFARKRTEAETASDTERVIAVYRKRWSAIPSAAMSCRSSGRACRPRRARPPS